MDTSFQVPEGLVDDLAQRVEEELLRIGLFHRVFGRVKPQHSIEEKILRKGYLLDGAHLQDLIGLRVALYFADDVDLVDEVLVRMFELHSRTQDLPDEDEFRPCRRNLVFKIPSEWRDRVVVSSEVPIDPTFEIQLRTVLAEGWHEVEHDLRYKCPRDWEGNADMSRALNGIEAVLETADWSVLQIFAELARRHYRAGHWVEMIRHKFRLRLIGAPLAEGIVKRFAEAPEVPKAIYEIPRTGFIRKLALKPIKLPLTASNVIYLANHLCVKDRGIEACTPAFVMDHLNSACYR